MTDAPALDAHPACDAQPEVAAQPWELRVLRGRAAGARTELTAGRPALVGYAFSSDVVLREASARALRLQLTPGAETVQLELLEGEVELLGHRLLAPATATLPAYAPLRIGELAFALGDPAGARWPEAERLLGVQETPASETASARRLISSLSARLPKLAALLPATAVALVSLALVLGVQAVAPALADGPPQPQQVSRALAAAGFRGLSVAALDDGGLVVRGRLAREADRARLLSLFEARSWPATLEVQTDETAARRVEDVFRTNGVEAVAAPAGPGQVRVEVSAGDQAAIEGARRAALTDVGGLRQLGVGSASPAISPLAAAGADGKRVTAVVAGEVSYLETADGARYFPGALLPSGHRIVSIAAQEVTVQKDGQLSHLSF